MAEDGTSAFGFRVVARDPRSGARAGLLRTPHGEVATPLFMPVGTQATVKAVCPRELRAAGAQIVLANTYHLSQRPGVELVAELGGLHAFMRWDGPILTDSGGFQVFSLAQPGPGSRGGLVAVDEDGVTFRSQLDSSDESRDPERPAAGAWRRLTPELAVEAQVALGADVIMAFDQCSTTAASHAEARAGMERTHRWAERCRVRWLEVEAAKVGRPPQALFGIVQGGAHRDLRRASAAFVAALDLPGVAVGGESVGFSKSLTRQVLEWVADLLPPDRPRYAMGVGEPDDFLAVVERGIDMFDSVLPTRMARTGTLLTRRGRLRVLNAEHAAAAEPVEPGCDCYTCARFTRAHLRYLFRSESLLAYRLATIHNLRFCLRLVAQARQAIVDGSFPRFRDEFLAEYVGTGAAPAVGVAGD